MRLKLIGLIILIQLFTISCATTDSGPRFNSLRAKKQQQIKQDLINNWSQYTIYFIPRHAVLFDPKDDSNTLLVSGRWIRAADKNEWPEILRDNTQDSDSTWQVWMGATSGFLEIIGPDEQVFGFLVHEKNDLVALRVKDRNTMRIYYSPARTSGP